MNERPVSSSFGSPARGTARDAGTIGAAATGFGAAAVTVVALSCCVSPVLAPMLVAVLGASGVVWAANLKPYSGLILAAAGVLLASGFWTVYRPRPTCKAGEGSGRKRVLPLVAKAMLWASAVTWCAALMLHLILP
jgi:hypothetical protein